MTDSNSYLDMFRKFGSDLGLLKFDVEKLLETQRRNLDALGQSAKALEAGLRQATSLAREYKPPDIPAAKGQLENKSRRGMSRGGAPPNIRPSLAAQAEDTMANLQATKAKKPDYVPPPINGDFYRIANVLDENGRALLRRVRDFTEGVVAPVIEEYWGRDEFPFAIIPKMAEVGIGGVGYHGYEAAGGSWLLNGFVAMELARVDASVATFWGVHTGLSAGSIYLCGD